MGLPKEEARRLKAARPEYLLCGEREGRKQPGCDFGNSPLEIAKQDLTGRVLIHTTSAGTQGLENAKGADFLLAASLVNAKATAEYLRRRNPSQVSLVCMGLAARRPTDEDTLCAQYIRALLLGLPFDKEQAVASPRGRILICASNSTDSLTRCRYGETRKGENTWSGKSSNSACRSLYNKRAVRRRFLGIGSARPPLCVN